MSLVYGYRFIYNAVECFFVHDCVQNHWSLLRCSAHYQEANYQGFYKLQFLQYLKISLVSGRER